MSLRTITTTTPTGTPIIIQGTCDTNLSKDLTIAIIVIVCILIALIIIFVILACTGVFTYSTLPSSNLGSDSEHPQKLNNDIMENQMGQSNGKDILVNNNDNDKNENSNIYLTMYGETGIWTSTIPMIDLDSKHLNTKKVFSFQLKCNQIKGIQCLMNNIVGSKGQFSLYLEDGFLSLAINGNESQILKSTNCIEINRDNFCQIILHKFELDGKKMFICQMIVNQNIVFEKNLNEFQFSQDLFPLSIGGMRTETNTIKYPILKSTLIEYFQYKENDIEKIVCVYDNLNPKEYKSFSLLKLTWKPFKLV